jgi:hypothetical protein
MLWSTPAGAENAAGVLQSIADALPRQTEVGSDGQRLAS